MDECGRNQHSRSKMATEEKRLVWDMQLRKSAYDERKGAGEGREHEDEDQGEDVDWDIVVAILGSRATRWSFTIILSSL